MSFQRPPAPWNDFYHIMCHTYGTWLPGDPKGFRTRHHRDHVEGDYKNPPPKGKHDALWKRSKDLMKRDPVYLTPEQRERAVQEFIRAFKKWGIELRALSIDRIHLHALARVIDHNPRHYTGLAKKESSAYMKRDALAPPGGLWSVRSKAISIASEAHFTKTLDYIRDHADQGACTHESAARIEFTVTVPSLLLDDRASESPGCLHPGS